MPNESQDKWVMVCKRTDDPKLKWIEQQLDLSRIPHCRGMRSYHADATLYVQSKDERFFWDFLSGAPPARYRRWYKTIDDMPDDHKMFQGAL